MKNLKALSLIYPLIFLMALSSPSFAQSKGNKGPKKNTNCSSHLRSSSQKLPDVAAIEYMQMKLETYSQIFPGFIPVYEVREVYAPLLMEMREKALNGLDFTKLELSEYGRLQAKLSGVPTQASVGGSPNKGLNPRKAREVLRFYEPWEWDYLF